MYFCKTETVFAPILKNKIAVRSHSLGAYLLQCCFCLLEPFYHDTNISLF